jgi:hypothetical protein
LIALPFFAWLLLSQFADRVKETLTAVQTVCGGEAVEHIEFQQRRRLVLEKSEV